MTARLVVLESGKGSNLQAILDACRATHLDPPVEPIDANVVAVVSDNADAFALERARALGIAAVTLTRIHEETRHDYDTRLAQAVQLFSPDVVVLAGFMRLLSMAFLGALNAPVVNLHPALPGTYPGLHAIERAFADARRGGVAQTGVMVHLVPDEGVDDGPVLASASVPITATDTLDTLTQRVHATEHTLLVLALRNLISSLSTSTPNATF